jgi:hypothetical protein
MVGGITLCRKVMIMGISHIKLKFDSTNAFNHNMFKLVIVKLILAVKSYPSSIVDLMKMIWKLPINSDNDVETDDQHMLI